MNYQRFFSHIAIAAICIVVLSACKIDDPEEPFNFESEMVFVKPGTFTMGCTDDECYDWEVPAHQVTLTKGYYISKYLVTQSQWKAVMGNNPSYFKGKNLPVETVSWDDIQEFLTKLNEKSGKNYRLPTEAEWEYACKGGNQSKGYKYSGSNNVDDVVWYWENSKSKTHPVGTKAPNELGIYDMSGNVWEWCHDWYDDYIDTPQTNPTGPDEGSVRVVRGGSWYYFARFCRVSHRDCNAPEDSFFNLGFRIALSE
jgi:formylglycine-generating enzyme required for sulfatase activity